MFPLPVKVVPTARRLEMPLLGVCTAIEDMMKKLPKILILVFNKGEKTENKDKGKSPVVTITGFRDLNEEFAECFNNSSNEVNAAGSSVSAAGLNFTNNTNDFSAAGPSNAAISNLEDLSHNADDVGAEADINNMESIILVSPTPTTRIHKDHPTSQIIGDLSSSTQTRSMARGVRDQGGISQMFNDDFHTCMFACFLSQEEPKRIYQALKDPSWIEAMQEEFLQFKMQKVWILVDLPHRKRAIGTKWVYRNKKDERVQTPGSGISILLAVGTPSTGSGNLYCQWELSPGSGNALCILFPTVGREKSRK
nr:hypothetical protein [Tanacetum cinerariifolium]